MLRLQLEAYVKKLHARALKQVQHKYSPVTSRDEDIMINRIGEGQTHDSQRTPPAA